MGIHKPLQNRGEVIGMRGDLAFLLFAEKPLADDFLHLRAGRIAEVFKLVPLADETLDFLLEGEQALGEFDVRKSDLHHPRLGIPRVVHQFPEGAFAGSVAFTEEGGKPGIDGEAGGGFHACANPWTIFCQASCPREVPQTLYS